MSLKQIAQEMKSYARRNPRLNTTADINPYRRHMELGLRIVLYLDRYQTWRLSLYRGATPPSRKEVEIIKRDFEVPAAADEKTEEVHGWPVMRLSWSERVPESSLQPTQLKLIDPPAAYNHYTEAD